MYASSGSLTDGAFFICFTYVLNNMVWQIFFHFILAVFGIIQILGILFNYELDFNRHRQPHGRDTLGGAIKITDFTS